MEFTVTDQLRRCEVCSQSYEGRPLGDMADLNNLCRQDAEQLAYQLSVDYNLPEGCSDEERQVALDGGNPREPYYVYSCITTSCITYKRTWSTQLTRAQWQSKYGRSPHCFRCGLPSILERVQFSETADLSVQGD